jgi:hypothetical protein
MTDRLLFLTGHLAQPRLRRILEGLGETAFTWEIIDIGVQVAALMTEAIILRRLPRPVQATRVIFPGCRRRSRPPDHRIRLAIRARTG